LDFVHGLQDALTEAPEFDRSGICEVDEGYVVGETGPEVHCGTRCMFMFSDSISVVETTNGGAH